MPSPLSTNHSTREIPDEGQEDRLAQNTSLGRPIGTLSGTLYVVCTTAYHVEERGWLRDVFACACRSGSDRNGAGCTARHSFRLIIQPMNERAGVMIGSWGVEDHLIGVIAGATPWNHAGSAKDACRIRGQEMIFVRIIDPLDRGPCFDGNVLWVKAIDVVSPCLLCDRHRERGP